jgi:hypothetical protein
LATHARSEVATTRRELQFAIGTLHDFITGIMRPPLTTLELTMSDRVCDCIDALQVETFTLAVAVRTMKPAAQVTQVRPQIPSVMLPKLGSEENSVVGGAE